MSSYKVLEMEGLSECAIHAFRIGGGPEHRVRNGSIQVALICYFLESKCDLVIGLNTCPTQSWTSPAERVMPVLNLAWGNTSLCRSKMPNNEDEEYMKSCCSMKELRKKVQGDPAIKQSVMGSVQPCRDLLMERALSMSYSGLQLRQGPVSTIADKENFFRHIRVIDPTMTIDVTTKDQLQAHPVFIKWKKEHVHMCHTIHLPNQKMWKRRG